MAKKALLMILDGWGIGDKGKGDVIYQTPTPYMDYLNANYPHSELQASGENVGLPDGQMGNSEVGHLNIGAGRIVYQDLVKINRACADNSILENPEIKSTGGVHSAFNHILKLIDIAKVYGIENCYVHCFMDGRDTDPKSGKGFIADLQKHIDEVGVGAITATSVGTASRWLTTSSYTARDVRWLIWSRVYNLVTTRTQRSTRTPTSLWSHSSTATWMGASRKVMLSSSSTTATTARRS